MLVSQGAPTPAAIVFMGAPSSSSQSDPATVPGKFWNRRTIHVTPRPAARCAVSRETSCSLSLGSTPCLGCEEEKMRPVRRHYAAGGRRTHRRPELSRRAAAASVAQTSRVAAALVLRSSSITER